MKVLNFSFPPCNMTTHCLTAISSISAAFHSRMAQCLQAIQIRMTKGEVDPINGAWPVILLKKAKFSIQHFHFM